ncbi:hypothetical protein [Mesomycoplasma ovipneumoniae]|nr:hypothetical protein [Mesomycoplasma ovipneumoniae]WNM16809.1 hypothetical protein RNM19_01595 [Mesomycoplasma ovipneumoniae]
MKNKHKNILTRAWRAKNAYKEGKDLGVIELSKISKLKNVIHTQY